MMKKNAIYKCLQLRCPFIIAQKSYGHVNDILSNTSLYTTVDDIIALAFQGYLRVHDNILLTSTSLVSYYEIFPCQTFVQLICLLAVSQYAINLMVCVAHLKDIQVHL
jgi:hypothetical protein